MKTISTEAQAKSAAPGKYRVDARGVVGLYFKKGSLTVGAGSFVYRYWHNGKRRGMGLGPLASISLASAVKRARELAVERNQGVDPIEQRRAKRIEERAKLEPVNGAQAVETHLKAHSDSWKHQRALKTWVNPLRRYGYPVLGRLDVNDVMPQHIAAIMRAAVKGDGKKGAGGPEVAGRIRGRLKAVFDGCIARGERDATRGNPADAGLIAAIYSTKKGKRPNFRRLEKIDAAPGAFQQLWTAAEAAGAVALDIWMFMVLTCARPGEALRAQWSEIDFDKRLWMLPASKTKTGREHVAPLSQLAIEILERRAKARTGDMVFAGRCGSAVSYSSFVRAPARIGLDLGSPHSWRSVWRDWCGDIGRVDRDLAEAQLAHSLGKTEASYRRGTAIEARRGPLEAYAKWLRSDNDAGVVVAFPSRA